MFLGIVIGIALTMLTVSYTLELYLSKLKAPVTPGVSTVAATAWGSLLISIFIVPPSLTSLLAGLVTIAACVHIRHSLRVFAKIVERTESQSMEFAKEIIEQIHVDEIREEIIRELLHDIRTPLTSIKGCSQAIVGEPSMPSELRAEFLEIINKESTVLNDLVSQLGDVSRSKGNTDEVEAKAGFAERFRERLQKRISRAFDQKLTPL